MATVRAQTPFGDLTFDHKGQSVSVSGSQEALAYWNALQRQGLYGAYGHIFQPRDCMVSDLTIALTTALGRNAVSWDATVSEQCKREMRLVPKGAIP